MDAVDLAIAPEAAASLPDVLRQISVSAIDALVDALGSQSDLRPLRLTCRALRDVVDGSVRQLKQLDVCLQPGVPPTSLAPLARWPRAGCVPLRLVLRGICPDVAHAQFLCVFAHLPQPARRQIGALCFARCGRARPALPGAALVSLPALLPCLHRLDLANPLLRLSSGTLSEAYRALAALGTLKELELPGVSGLTGVEALAGSLRRLGVWSLDAEAEEERILTLEAAACFSQLTRLVYLELEVSELRLGPGSSLGHLIRLAPPSLRSLKLHSYRLWSQHSLSGTFGIDNKRLVSARLMNYTATALAALARNELLPCLGSSQLALVSVETLRLDVWVGGLLLPLTELRLRTALFHVRLLVPVCRRCAGTVSRLMPFLNVSKLGLLLPDIRMLVIPVAPPLNAPQPESSQPPPAAGLPDASRPSALLPRPSDMFGMALRRISVATDGTSGGWDRCSQFVVLQGPVAFGALKPRDLKGVYAWARALEARARAAPGGSALPREGALISNARPVPRATAVMVECVRGGAWLLTAKAICSAVAAAGDGSEAWAVSLEAAGHGVEGPLFWGLEKAIAEAWAEAASADEEGTASLELRVRWALEVRELVGRMPYAVHV